jgi:hypothetical protein
VEAFWYHFYTDFPHVQFLCCLLNSQLTSFLTISITFSLLNVCQVVRTAQSFVVCNIFPSILDLFNPHWNLYSSRNFLFINFL